ncbi:MAG: DUF3108 domain-containing protein [Acidobacteria bacterium]|jgi:hypothetical protein|nr:MAG: DUF3108 domain-containing protein [Acidobacteriota bacterium]GIU83067.1 MAG: hypothetical protein KatS3mg006_2131 [Pyrinomonadaceae bacterium]
MRANWVTRLFFLFLLFFVYSEWVFLQSAPPKPEILLPGETLVYEVKFSKSILRGISIGTLSFSVSKSVDNKSYEIKFEGRSKGILVSLFGKKILQVFHSVIDEEKFRVLKTLKRDEQGDRIRDSEAIFDYNQMKVVFTEIDPKDPLKPPRRISSEIAEETHDLVSGVYRLRQVPLEVGKTFETVVSDSGLVYKIPVKVTAREKQDTVLGDVWCYRIEPEVFGKGRFIEQEGKMVIWIADNERKIPVGSRLETEIGRIEVKLKKVQIAQGK